MSNIHFKTSFDYIRRSPFQALAAISVLGLTFFIGTILAVLIYSSSQVLTYFETRPQVIAFLKKDVTEEEIALLQQRLQTDPRVKDVKFVSRESALEIYKRATSDNPLLAELVSPSTFPASIEFSLTDLEHTEAIISQIKNEGIVDSVGFTASLGGESTLNDAVTRLKTAINYIRIGGGVLVGFLGIASFLVLIVVIGMRLATRKAEIETLNLIGATAGFIRAPIVLEAITYAITGVVIGWVLALILTLYITPSVLKYFSEVPVLPRDALSFFGLLGAILVAELFVGVLIALGGSITAVSRSLKFK